MIFFIFFQQINEVSPSQTFNCSAEGCSKTCKTKGGLRRHVITKHPEVIEDEIKQKQVRDTERACDLLHPLDLKRLVKEFADALCKNECLPST